MKVALLGAWHVHAKDYISHALRLSEVVGVYDEDKERGENFANTYHIPLFESREALLASDAQGVIVCASTNKHLDNILAVVNAGKHVFTEKVLELSVENCEKIACAVEKNKVNFVISLVQKYTSGPRTIYQLVQDGKLGKINYFRFHNCHNGSTGDWLPLHFYNREQCGGGAMIDLGAHGMYLTDWFLGLPQHYASTFTIAHENSKNTDQVEDNAITVMSYPNGCVAVNETSFVSVGAPMRLEVGGSLGTAVFENNTVTLTDASGRKEIPMLPALPAPIEQFLKGEILPGCGMKEAIALTKLMVGAYQNAK